MISRSNSFEDDLTCAAYIVLGAIFTAGIVVGAALCWWLS